MATSVSSQAQLEKDSNDIRLYVFDWSDLPAAVTISTSTFTLTTLRPPADASLTKDQESILAGSRSTQLRLTGGTLWGYYQVANKIVTNESPAQTYERSFFLLIQDR